MVSFDDVLLVNSRDIYLIFVFDTYESRTISQDKFGVHKINLQI